ncbi:hypothetical protein S245_046255 [Arachis hypogaea]
MDDLLNSIYTTTTTTTSHPSNPSSSPPPPPKTVDDVWKDMILTHSHRDSTHHNHHPFEEMTLEAFLSKNAAVTDDDVTAVAPLHNHHPVPHQFPQVPAVEGSSSSAAEPFANGIDAAVASGVPAPSSSSGGGGGGGGGGAAAVAKGKRRAVEEPVDKATLQKQRRMIKNRESAARSRERKQAYTTDLESNVQQLEIENARLLSEEAEKKKKRLKELLEFVIPVVEKRKPKKLLRTNSVQSL